ncbi:interferon-induced protein 44-like [Centropristis striata]|uniref:interferon-induced protein 44-like n=1 Tax=Centropristis striata TaxID=184440 RepID=UPI0027E0F280|nr:interferon-induced protein 44-like [Centropristis striata]
MGIFSSKTPPPPPPSPLLSAPWRTVNWRDKHNDLQYVKDYKPHVEGHQLRILLYGLGGAGKSSFINSVDSVLQGRICTQAAVDTIGHDSFTKQYKTYNFKKGNPDTFSSFVINDIMGLKSGSNRNRKVHVKDVKRAMKGNMRDTYTFNPESKLSKEDPYYNDSPTTNDKVHILVCVVDANTFSQMTEKVVETIMDIRDEAADLGIPQVAILTKIDEACPEIKGDIKNVYKSKELKKKMEMFSKTVGIPMNCIFPVKNYSSELEVDDETDYLILNAMRRMIDSGNDFLNKIPRQLN